jgi:hypothetical protein
MEKIYTTKGEFTIILHNVVLVYPIRHVDGIYSLFIIFKGNRCYRDFQYDTYKEATEERVKLIQALSS